jgi:hypothetical protein
MGSHCSLDWQRNDRLGWIQRPWPPLSEHRRAILRAIRRRANAYTNCHSDSDNYARRDADGNSYADIHTSTITYTEDNSGAEGSTNAAAPPVAFDPIASNWLSIL